MPRKSARRKAIERRIVDAVKKCAALGFEPRAIYLNDADLDALINTHPKRRHDKAEVDGIPVRLGVYSRLFAKRDVAAFRI